MRSETPSLTTSECALFRSITRSRAETITDSSVAPLMSSGTGCSSEAARRLLEMRHLSRWQVRFSMETRMRGFTERDLRAVCLQAGICSVAEIEQATATKYQMQQRGEDMDLLDILM